ncbi:MAG: phage protease [Burkholderiaceae bacterium]|nr:phage protease [Burkholderiaceae bacterium]
MKKTAVALLTLALALQATADVHLLPVGEFVGRDGRPGKGLTWKLSDQQGRTLAAKLTARHARVQFNLDYEHQSMLSEQNGQPAPASGWATAFEWRDGVGLFALNVQWTARAKEMIEAGEYKYISPVIVYDKETGQVIDVLNASLVNIPNLDLSPVAQERVARLNASFSTHPEQSMNEVLKALLKALGLPVTEATTAEQAVTAVSALKAAALPADLVKALGLAETATPAEAVTAAAALKANADKAAGLTTEVAALKASGAGSNPDPTKFVSLESFNALNGEVAALRAAGVATEVDKLIDQARAEGKCSPVVEKVWRDIGKVDVAQLKALIKDTPANPALAGQTQTGGKAAAALDPKAPGTPEELAMCKSMGLTLEQFRGGAEVAA